VAEKNKRARIVDDEVIPDYPEIHFGSDDDEPEPEPENELDDEDLVALNTEAVAGEDIDDDVRSKYPDYSELGPTEPLGPAEPN
jgi:hypothetical protein